VRGNTTQIGLGMMDKDERDRVVSNLTLLTTGGMNITVVREGLSLIEELQAEVDRLEARLAEYEAKHG
jgi:hypothetical protein